MRAGRGGFTPPNGFGTRAERFSVKANPFVCPGCGREKLPLPGNCQKACSPLVRITFLGPRRKVFHITSRHGAYFTRRFGERLFRQTAGMQQCGDSSAGNRGVSTEWGKLGVSDRLKGIVHRKFD